MIRAKIFQFRRTPEIEELLKDIWQMRPELREKQSFTGLMALAALKRELSGQTIARSTIATEPEAEIDNDDCSDNEWD